MCSVKVTSHDWFSQLILWEKDKAILQYIDKAILQYIDEAIFFVKILLLLFKISWNELRFLIHMMKKKYIKYSMMKKSISFYCNIALSFDRNIARQNCSCDAIVIISDVFSRLYLITLLRNKGYGQPSHNVAQTKLFLLTYL